MGRGVDVPVDPLRLAAARADFLDSRDVGAPGVPDVVAASWRRSRSAGVHADTYEVPYHDDVDVDSRLVRCARPVLERLELDMADLPVSIALTDARARIVDRRDCSPAVGRVLDQVQFNPGFSFDETGVGTNGIGTVFATGAPVSVVGPAHFSEPLVQFACTGAPVLNPLSGRIEGVLDVSLLAESWSPLIHALVRSAAGDIGRNLVLDRSQVTQALFDRFVRTDARTRHAVIAVGDTVISNRAAQQLLSPDEQATLHDHARYLMTRRHVTSDVLPLETGRVLHLVVSRVAHGDGASGVVLTITEVASQPPPPSSPSPATYLRQPARSRCPAWRLAEAQLRAALLTPSNVVVLGEPGSGRSTLLTDLLDDLWPGVRPLVLDAADLTGAHRTDVSAAGAQRADAGAPTVLVLRGVDRLTTDGADVLRGLLGTAERGRLVVAATLDCTEADGPRGLPCLAVLPHFDRAVRVPPLRYRGADLGAIVSRMLGELAPDRRVRLSPAADRVVHAYSWPGNHGQLREALLSALSRRPVGEVQVEDLPGSCRTTSTRALTPIEVAERDTIIAALRSHGGNRVHAAAELGLSRSSLYRKLSTYGVIEV